MGYEEKKGAGRVCCAFGEDWLFCKLTQADHRSELPVERIDFDDSDWEKVTLPHTWNAIDGADGWSGKDEGGEDYYRGLGGYRKRIVLSETEFWGKQLFLEFEGANTVTELFVNGVSVGKHEGGYAAFRFDITKYVKLGESNLFTVKVNNAPTDYIAPITNQGDFTKMGGIYREVTLIAVHPQHIDLMDHGSSGIYVTPTNCSKEHADIGIVVKLANDAEEKKGTLLVALKGQAGESVGAVEREVVLPAGEATEVRVGIPMENPVFWNGTKNPYLYQAEISLCGEEGLLDQVVQPFGVRTCEMNADRGFFLNGEYLDLRGVNYHQDSYENGWAMTDAQRERDYAMMLDLGCTSVRMAHYQHDAYEYDLCDRLGITVWTELGIVNKMSADETEALALAPGFAENAKQQLIELIRQNYNHPSIIVWGVSNELYQMSDEIYDLYVELNALANAEDETRAITFADAQFWGRFLTLPGDVVGYNRYFGWYKDAGPAEKFGEWLDHYHNTQESRPICVSEYGGGGAITQYKDNINWAEDIDPWGKRHYANYQSAMHEAVWAQFAKRPYLWGKYVWCMFDFASDGREEGDTKGQNDKGLVTRTRQPKDAYYFYKSVWNPQPMVHLTEHGFTERASLVPQVKAYSNADCLELFVNGSSKGRIQRTELSEDAPTSFVWNEIPLCEGEDNEVLVKASFTDGSVLTDRATWRGISQTLE